jgi:hypothetical protein
VINSYKIKLSGSDSQKSKQLIDIIDKINTHKYPRFNRIELSPAMLTIIEISLSFQHSFSNKNNNYLEIPIMVGHLNNMECYVNLYTPLTDVILTYDKKTIRDIKINTLISDSDLDYITKIEVEY